MAIGDPYATLAQLKDYIGPITDTADDAKLQNILLAASAEIELWCGRQFNQVASPTTRVFEPMSFKVVRFHDFFTTTGLTILTDPGGVGNFSQTLTSAQYELYPQNGYAEDGTPWVYTEAHAVGGLWFPRVEYRRRQTVQITAQWGWASVPWPVYQACLIMSAQMYKMKDAPWGVAGMSETGTAVRVQSIPRVKELLHRYRRRPVMGA